MIKDIEDIDIDTNKLVYLQKIVFLMLENHQVA